MGLAFFETMAGRLVDGAGVPQPVAFEVKAEAARLRELLRNGQTRITGVVDAGSWASAAPLTGELVIAPVRGRTITYAFRFRDAEERELVFRGRKDLRWLRPVHSMTVLRGELVRDGEVLGAGELRFDLRDLPSFLGSFTPTLPELGVEPDELSAQERALFRAFAEALIVPGRLVPPVDDETVDGVERILASMPDPGPRLMKSGLRAIDIVARLRHRRAFASLDLDRRRRLVASLVDPEGPGARLGAHRVVHFLGMPVKMAHFNRPAYLRALGMPAWEAPRPEPDAGWAARINTPDGLDAEMRLEADVVVIGTGAGGAVVASELAERGLAVALVEEGRYLRREAFAGKPIDRMERFWRDAGMMVTVGTPPVSVPLGKLVGGTTAINSGTCFRTPDDVLAEWRQQLGFPDEFAPDAFGRYHERVEVELQVAKADPRYLGAIADVVSRGADAMGLRHGPLPRNAPACDGQATCMLGCPSDAKRSTNVSYVPRALQAGAELFTGMKVERILMRGARAVGVEARGQTEEGEERVLHLSGRAVVIACGALITPVLLARNGFAHPWLGRNLSLHPAAGLWVKCDQQMSPWTAIPQGYSVEAPEDGVKYEGYWVPPQIAAMTLPLAGEALTDWMDDHARVGQFGFMVRDEGNGSVRTGPGGRPFVRYTLSERSFGRLRRGTALLSEILLRGGGREVMTGLPSRPVVRTVDEARALVDAPVRPGDLQLLGAHPLGTCRVAATPSLGVLDLDHRVWGTDNLYVVDGSAVPTSLGVNPQMTIMALATRAADRLAARLAA